MKTISQELAKAAKRINGQEPEPGPILCPWCGSDWGRGQRGEWPCGLLLKRRKASQHFIGSVDQPCVVEEARKALIALKSSARGL